MTCQLAQVSLPERHFCATMMMAHPAEVLCTAGSSLNCLATSDDPTAVSHGRREAAEVYFTSVTGNQLVLRSVTASQTQWPSVLYGLA